MSLKDVEPKEGELVQKKPKRRRRRGGQDGNLNAFKHGVYSSVVSDEERRLVEEYEVTGLMDEVKMAVILFNRASNAFEEGLCNMEMVSAALKDVVRIKRQHVDMINNQLADGAAPIDRARAIADALREIESNDGTGYKPLNNSMDSA